MFVAWVFATALGLFPLSPVGGPGCFRRTLSFGTQTASGSRFVETLLIVIETCRRQNRNVFAFVTDAVQANLASQPTPKRLFEV